MGRGVYDKDYLRIAAYGAVDELNSIVGWGLAKIEQETLRTPILEVQKQLFLFGAELASVETPREKNLNFLEAGHVIALEKQIDGWEEELSPLRNFILPGGTEAAAVFHLARTVCRRAERQLVSLSQKETIRPQLLQYINRLSDWFFVLARVVNHRAKVPDVLWGAEDKE